MTWSELPNEVRIAINAFADDRSNEKARAKLVRVLQKFAVGGQKAQLIGDCCACGSEVCIGARIVKRKVRCNACGEEQYSKNVKRVREVR